MQIWKWENKAVIADANDEFIYIPKGKYWKWNFIIIINETKNKYLSIIMLMIIINVILVGHDANYKFMIKKKSKTIFNSNGYIFYYITMKIVYNIHVYWR